MRIFNEESVGKNTEVILLLKRKEAMIIIEALEYAYDKRPKKLTWKKLLDDLLTKVYVY